MRRGEVEVLPRAWGSGIVNHRNLGNVGILVLDISGVWMMLVDERLRSHLDLREKGGIKESASCSSVQRVTVNHHPDGKCSVSLDIHQEELKHEIK